MTRILGILNITPDSFSDGGRYLAPDAALAHASALIAAGADALDLGPASSHPDAPVVPAAEELRRLGPVLPALVARGVRVSVDTWRPQTQVWACEHGAQYLNDIHGFADPQVYPALAAHPEVRLIAMFSIQQTGNATRAHTPPGTVVGRIQDFFDRRIDALVSAGIGPERLILDPGMGFFLGSGPEPSLEVLRALPALRARYGLPLLVSVSRKSFLRRLAGVPVAGAGAVTLAAEVACAQAGVDWLRTHEPEPLRQALAFVHALRGEAPSAP